MPKVEKVWVFVMKADTAWQRDDNSWESMLNGMKERKNILKIEKVLRKFFKSCESVVENDVFKKNCSEFLFY